MTSDGASVPVSGIFTYDLDETPVIYDVTPRYISPGGLVDISGLIYTDKYLDTDEEQTEYEQLERVHFGPSVCELFLTDSPDGLYGLSLDGEDELTGHCMCRPSSTDIGSFNASLLFSGPKGRSAISRNALLVDAQLRTFLVQYYSTVMSVSPVRGSEEGNTLITVDGEYFHSDRDRVKVFVDQSQCDIVTSSIDRITCRTPRKVPGSAVYPGQRGWTLNVWEGTYTLSQVAPLIDTASTVYSVENTNLYPNISIDDFAIKLSGFFVAPQTGHYSFSTSSGVMHINTLPYPDLNGQLVDCDRKCNKIQLQKGMLYYLYAFAVNTLPSIDVSLFETVFVNSILSSARDELQRIKTTNNPYDEWQRITVLNMNKGSVSIQKTSMPLNLFEICCEISQLNETANNMTTCNSTMNVTTEVNHTECHTSSINVIFQGNVSTFLINSTAEFIENELNNVNFAISNAGGVNISVIRNDTRLFLAWRFREVGVRDRLSLEVSKFICGSNQSSVSNIPVTVISYGINPDTDFVLTFDNVKTKPIPFSANEEEIRRAISDIFTRKCQYPIGIKYLLQDFEEEGYYISGSRTGAREPFCGKRAVKNPYYIFRANSTYASLNGGSLEQLDEFDAREYKYLCLAFSGPISNNLYLRVRWQKEDLDVMYSDIQIHLDMLGGDNSDWDFRCENIFDKLVDHEAFGDISGSSGYAINNIRIRRLSNEVYVDEVVFAKNYAYIVQDVSLPARPNGIFVDKTTVDNLNPITVNNTRLCFDTRYTTFECGYDFPLIRVAYDKFNSTTTRIQHASPPIQGNFTLSQNSKLTPPIDVQASSEHVRKILEETFQDGGLRVTRYGDCRGYRWDVEWVQSGGDKETMDVDDAFVRLFGDVSIEVSVRRNGGLDLPFIPGDMLRNSHTSPQVSVFVNDIPAFCEIGQCDYEYASDATPEITSVNPSFGKNGSIVSISGTNFGTETQGIYVLIGEVNCTQVELVSGSVISCVLPFHACGILPLKINIPGLGFSATFSFEYKMTLIRSVPPSLSTEGGTLLAITGYSMGSSKANTSVAISSKDCKILYINDTHLECRSPPNPVGSHPISVTIRGVADDSLQVDYAVIPSPTISAVEPSTLGVCGGRITILGSNFGTELSKLEISVRELDCLNISVDSTQIVCTAPPLTPGSALLTVTHSTFGNGAFNLSYVLSLDSLTPWIGSSLGGTILGISGQGFCSSADDVVITLSDDECAVRYVNNTYVECEVASTSREHAVDNTGYSSLYGYGYSWNPSTITIAAGDTVRWTWNGAQLIQYRVVQTYANGSDFVGGFSSDMSSVGAYSRCFYTPGTYYYKSSEPTMNGVINVTELPSFVSEIMFSVNGFSPSSFPFIPQNFTVNPIDNTCETPIPSIVSYNKLQFIFWRCLTGSVLYTSPAEGYFTDIIQITGDNFMNYELVVTLDNTYTCDVIQKNNTVAQCQLSEYSVPACMPLQISVAYATYGYALLSTKSTYTLKPTVTSVYPLSGSTEGCTNVTISGHGMSNVTQVIIGSECVVLTQSYHQIVCSTSKTSVGSYSIEVYTCSGVETYSLEYDYSISKTPQISQLTVTEGTAQAVVSIYVNSFNTTDPYDVTVWVGEYICGDTQFNGSASTIECSINSLVVGEYLVSVLVKELGCASIPSIINTLSVKGEISSLSPTAGSMEGCTLLTISGYGFSTDSAVTIGQNKCDISEVTFYQIKCTTSKTAEGTKVVSVEANGSMITSGAIFAFSDTNTPSITGLSPMSGSGGNIEITGTKFGSDLEDINVQFGSNLCTVSSVEDTNISCHLPSTLIASDYTPLVTRQGYGCSQTSLEYEYALTVADVSFQSSVAGRNIQLNGYGFDPINILVSICDKPCSIDSSNSSSQVLLCRTPPNLLSNSELDYNSRTCDISVSLNSRSVLLEAAFSYTAVLTSQVSAVTPARGGTGGGLTLNITGEGFGSEQSNIIVLLGELQCQVQTVTNTEIHCITPASSETHHVQVDVHIEDKGYANSNVTFEYIDVWSSTYTWGGEGIPVEGDFAVISQNQTILLDVSTPVLSFLLIRGKLIFDERDIELNSEYILITDGGELQVGTEDNYFKHKAGIKIHGHARKPELPVYGSKVLAVRDGTLELHGKPIPVTWSRLNKTAEIGDTEIVIEHEVNWEVGNEIVVATTGFGPIGSERVEITNVSVTNGTTKLGIYPALQFQHLSVTMSNGVQDLPLKAEVGLLSRNVVFEGSVNDEWTEQIEACPRAFDHGQHATQSCFQGRFGEEIGSDQFGAHIMIHSPTHQAEARIEYVEVRNVGQAFRLGRYPIHYHVSGNVSNSYVRGCGIHDTFNRAVTIHAVHNLLVEHNVAYNVKGHAYFLEDGIETGNIIRYNLAIFVRSSSSLLNVDVTPAAFWITNPDNIVSHNAAAGGTTFGFWVRLSEHPGGPSFDSTICPRNVLIREFTNNTAHSHGRYGLWIFPTYTPKLHGTCGSTVRAVSLFSDFLSWHNMRGAESAETGAVHWRNFNLISNELAGMEVTVPSVWHTEDEDGGLVYDSFIASRIPEIEENLCCVAGIKTGHKLGSTFRNITFAYFDKSSCSAIAGCSHCKPRQGGWEVRWSGVKFVNSPSKLAFLWEHETVHADLDGSIVGQSGSFNIVPSMGTLPPSRCMLSVSELSIGAQNGSYCWNTTFRRMAWNKAKPESLLYVNALISNEHGTSVVPFKFKRLTHPNGWMALLIVNSVSTLLFENLTHITNISYNAGFYEIAPEEDLWIRHSFLQEPDYLQVIEDQEVSNSEYIPQRPNVTHGDWHFNHSSLDLYYIVSGIGLVKPSTLETELTIYQCYFERCVIPVPPPPPTGRPDNYKRWGKPFHWVDKKYGITGPPADGDDVFIPSDWWMVIDVELPTIRNLTIEGVLEFDDYIDYVLNVTYIVILGEGAGLIAGIKRSFTHKIHIRMMGDHDTPELVYPGAPIIGAKVITNFGLLQLRGVVPDVAWTFANSTITENTTTIVLAEEVDWGIDVEILITSSSFDHFQTEVATISYIAGDRQTVYVKNQFKYTHRVVRGTTDNGAEYCLRPEVALLHRNIVIEGVDDPVGSVSQRDFGARVLSSRIYFSNKPHFAITFLEGVKFYHSGQFGHTDSYDPRYALSFLNLGTPNSNTSFVRSCVFYDSRSPALGVFNSHNIEISDNVIYGTIGDSVIIAGDHIDLTHNLAVQTKFPQYFLTTVTSGLLPHVTTFELTKANDLKLQNNSAAGSDYIGFHINGEHCDEVDAARQWLGNIAHTNLHGIHMLYDDGIPHCTKVSKFTSYTNWDWGVFTYTRQRMKFQDLILVDNRIGLHAIVYEPRALQHSTSDKYISIKNSLFVGNSDVDNCRDLLSKPKYETRTSNWRPIYSSNGGNVGLTLATFMSGRGAAPNKPYEKLLSYSAISGITLLKGVTFANYLDSCGDKAIQSHKVSGDAMHPVEIRDCHRSNVDQNSTFFIFRPLLSWVDPSDCVDLDCDGPKKVLIKMLDTSFLGLTSEIVSQSEFEWDGDMRRGLGDYRIPISMQTANDGSRVNITMKYPNKGIYRDEDCHYKSEWQSHLCPGVNHDMMIVESLDADTETRRISPVGLAADGFIDIINGPMDHGWCLGYTCQERISTFYTIVRNGLNYSLAFSGTNPQVLRVFMLNTDLSRSIVVALFYPSPQRLDVYNGENYILPTNGILDTNLRYVDTRDTLTKAQYVPTIDLNPGANFYDRSSLTLYFVVKGDAKIKLETTMIIQLRFNLASITVDEFFEENIVRNIALLLNIPESKIRITRIVGIPRITRRAVESLATNVTLEIEIGDPPQNMTNLSPSDTYTYVPPVTNQTDTDNTTTPSPPNATNATSLGYTQLLNISNAAVGVTQSGELEAALDANIDTITVTNPLPAPERANYTGLNDSALNSTQLAGLPLFMSENGSSLESSTFKVPEKLKFYQTPFDANETVPFGQQPLLFIADENNQVVSTLRHMSDESWKLTVSIHSGSGHPSAVLSGTTTVAFVGGWANFTDIAISHAGAYKLDFNITTPNSNLSVSSNLFYVKERIIILHIIKHVTSTNETVAFNPAPLIELVDIGSGARVTNHGWKGWEWVARAILISYSGNGKFVGKSMRNFTLGLVEFLDISIHSLGNYSIRYNVYTVPASNYSLSITHKFVIVRERKLYLTIDRHPNDCNETVVCGEQPVVSIRDQANGEIVQNIGWRKRVWKIHTVLYTNNHQEFHLNGSTENAINGIGTVLFEDLRVFGVGVDFYIRFNISTNPASNYNGLWINSDAFDVNERVYYLKVDTLPSDCNQSVVCAVTPDVGVYDYGTGEIAPYLNSSWQISVYIQVNPPPRVGSILGYNSTSLGDSIATFDNFSISEYGDGYTIRFDSNFGHTVLSMEFDVYYVNDHTPIFHLPNLTSVSIYEENITGILVTTFYAIDLDQGSQGDVSYSLQSMNPVVSGILAINETNGNLNLLNPIDRELSPYNPTIQIELTIRASDLAYPEKVNFADYTFVIVVVDINDNPPLFPFTLWLGNCLESYKDGRTFLTVGANDIDDGVNSEIRYSLVTEGVDYQVFGIDPILGVVYVLNESLIDFDNYSLPDGTVYNYILVAKDLGNPSMSSNSTLRITIEHVNEFAPVFQALSSYSFTFAEENNVSLFVTQVLATDADYGNEGVVGYLLPQHTDIFSIGQNGTITVTGK